MRKITDTQGSLGCSRQATPQGTAGVTHEKRVGPKVKQAE